MSNNSVYAVPRMVSDVSECFFYHTMDIPGHGVVKGTFDLREGVRDYLGNVDFSGKRVLEVGTASGFLCFYMESKGAEVVAYDLSENYSWDVVPHYTIDSERKLAEFREIIKRLNNSYWFSHRAFKSNAKVVYGTVYAIPKEIGMVDISTFAAVLLHLRDPFLALQNALRLTKETVIITDAYHAPHLQGMILGKLRFPNLFLGFPYKLPNSPHMEFVPNPLDPKDSDTWWSFTPEILVRMISVLGFEKVKVSYHRQKSMNSKVGLFTIVGHRTREYYSY